MRFTYLGLPLGALALARAGHPPAVVGVFHLDAPGMRRLRRTLPRATLLLGRPDLERAAVARAILSRGADALLSFYWPREIPEDLIEAHPRGGFGVHPSLLPRHRGPDPFFWTLLEGDARTGVTLHRLARGYDTGDVVETRSIDVPDDVDAHALARLLDRPALELLVEAAARLARGELPRGRPQDERAASLAPLPSERDLSIDWREPAERVVRRVRAAAPDPGCVAELGETTVVILRARVSRGPGGFLPAEAHVEGGTVRVRAADGFVELLDVRDLEGRRLDAAALFGPQAS